MPSVVKRVSKDGKSVTYQVKCRFKGEKPFSKTFSKLRDAKQWAADMQSSRDKRRAYTDPGTYKTVGDAIDLRLNNGIDRADRGRLNWWKGQCGTIVLRELSDQDLLNAAAKLTKRRGGHKVANTAQPVSPATWNRYIVAISAALEAARDERWLSGDWTNPARLIRKKRENNTVTRWLNDDERERLLRACAMSEEPGLLSFVLSALWTGARRGELMELKWEQVDLQAKRAYLTDTKNGDARTLVLLDVVTDALKGWQNRDGVVWATGYVWPGRKANQPKDFRIPFDKALKAAGIADFRFHDLRHTAGSYLAKAGVNQAQIMRTMGHRSFAASKRYLHLDDEDVENALKQSQAARTSGGDNAN